MVVNPRICLFLATILSSMASAQMVTIFDKPNPRIIRMDVAVTSKTGELVTDLQQQDFTLLDNKTKLPLYSFQFVRAAQRPVHIILLIDELNAPFSHVTYVREQLETFLRENEGQLAHPTTIAVLTEKGIGIHSGFSRDGNVVADLLKSTTHQMREYRASTAGPGLNERLQISMAAVRRQKEFADSAQGRTVFIWISPGWPIPFGPGVQLDKKLHQEIFDDIVDFSTQFRKSDITIYNLDPVGPREQMGRSNYYENFLKGISKPGDTEIPNVMLRVLALQSGGLLLQGNSDLTGMLRQAFADLQSWYHISFEAPIAKQRDEYHHVEIKLDKPGLTARTRDGYYAQP